MNILNKCPFCGSEFVDGKCPNGPHFKPMCLNCNDCNDIDTDKPVCVNEENKNNALEKIKESVPSGYEIETIAIKPLPLKDVTKKCKKWSLYVGFDNLYLKNGN
jgi:hypothetical protein